MALAEQRWGRRVGRAPRPAGTLCPRPTRGLPPAVRAPGLRQALMAFQRSLSKLLILPV